MFCFALFFFFLFLFLQKISKPPFTVGIAPLHFFSPAASRRRAYICFLQFLIYSLWTYKYDQYREQTPFLLIDNRPGVGMF